MQTRRQFGCGLISISSASLLPSVARAAPFDPLDPDDNLLAHVKLRGGTKKELIIWFLQGSRYGVVDGATTKLWDSISISFNAFDEVESNVFASKTVEVSFVLDPASRQILREYENPYTGAIIRPQGQLFGPNTILLSKDGVTLPPEMASKALSFESHVGPAIVYGDELWLPEDIYGVVPPFVPGGKPWRANDITTYKGRVSDVVDAQISATPATLSFQSITSWRPWAGMDQVGGNMMSRLAGIKLFDMTDLPDYAVQLVESEHPGLLDRIGTTIGL